MRAIWSAIVIGTLLSACSANKMPQVNSEGEAESVILTNDQMAVVEAGLKEMTGAPLKSSLRGTRAIQFAGKPGIHVCGAIDHNAQETAYYVELREKDGKPFAERGQLATDDSKKSKIAFVCRHHS